MNIIIIIIIMINLRIIMIIIMINMRIIMIGLKYIMIVATKESLLENFIKVVHYIENILNMMINKLY